MDLRRTAEHLDLLGILFYVAGGLTAVSGLFPLLYLVLGAFLVFGDLPHHAGEPDPAVFGGFFIAFAVVFILLVEAMALVQILAGRALRRRERLWASQLLSGLSCLNVPFGTILGVLALVALSKEEARVLYEPASLEPPPVQTVH